MRRTITAAALALALLPAPALAGALPGNGITLKEMTQILTAHGYPAKPSQGDAGQPIVSSSVDGVNFDVYFYQCDAAARCSDIQFAAGWGGAQRISHERVNEWNTHKRFVRCYWKPDGALWAEQDARVRRGTTENVEEFLALWKSSLADFKKFMGI